MNINKLDSKKYISVTEASLIFNKSIPTIRKLIQDKKVIIKKDGVKVLIELLSIKNVYQVVINKDINKVDKNINTSQETSILSQNIIDNLTKENESLKLDKLNHYEETKRFQDQLDKFHTLMENQQTLMLGLQQQIKSLTSNSTQNISENSKPQQTTVEAKVSNPPKASKNNENYDLFNESNETLIEIKNTPQKRRKWWFF